MSVKSVPGCFVAIAPSLIGVPLAFWPLPRPHFDAAAAGSLQALLGGPAEPRAGGAAAAGGARPPPAAEPPDRPNPQAPPPPPPQAATRNARAITAAAITGAERI